MGDGGRARIDLRTALRNDRLVIVGDPGSGKTTFLRRVAFSLCRVQIGDPDPTDPFCQAFSDNPLPIFVRLANLHRCMQRCANALGAPTHPASAAWLPTPDSVTTAPGSGSARSVARDLPSAPPIATRLDRFRCQLDGERLAPADTDAIGVASPSAAFSRAIGATLANRPFRLVMGCSPSFSLSCLSRPPRSMAQAVIASEVSTTIAIIF